MPSTVSSAGPLDKENEIEERFATVSSIALQAAKAWGYTVQERQNGKSRVEWRENEIKKSERQQRSDNEEREESDRGRRRGGVCVFT